MTELTKRTLSIGGVLFLLVASLFVLCIVGCSHQATQANAIQKAINETHRQTAVELAIAFQESAALVRSGKIQHARGLQEDLRARVVAARARAREPFDRQWSIDIPDDDLTDPDQVAKTIEAYAAAWQQAAK